MNVRESYSRALEQRRLAAAWRWAKKDKCSAVTRHSASRMFLFLLRLSVRGLYTISSREEEGKRDVSVTYNINSGDANTFLGVFTQLPWYK